MAEGRSRATWAEVDLSAVRHNVGVLCRRVAPATLCAVVKADGYGHGAAAVARAALDGGASMVAVALGDEGEALRRAGIEAPVLVLSEQPAAVAPAVVAAGLTPTLYTLEGVAATAAAAEAAGTVVPVHVKVDTGMHRVGADPAAVPAVAAAVAAAPSLRLEGLFTHLAVADGPSDEDAEYTALQLDRFDAVAAAVADRGAEVRLRHAANSAGAIAWPRSRYDMVRCGIAVYGQPPSPSLAPLTGDLRPVLSLRSRVSAVRVLDAGERPSYGRVRPLPERSVVATVPIGYADGLARRLQPAGGEVLIGGRRRPLAGTVTMDQIVVDCGPDDPVRPGDEVVLLGRQGDAEVTALEWAQRLGTITYEVLCGIGPRVPRVVVDPERVAQ
ncbi:MAG: alanine racemase [Acidimicrobiales bacterium]